MSRRILLRAIGYGLVALVFGAYVPLARAAQPDHRVVRLGVVYQGSRSSYYDAFWERLRELGYVEGENLVVEARWAEGHLDRLPLLMREVIARKIDVLITNGTPGAIAAKNATSTIPIVDAVMGDPVGAGIAVSLARPGGNLTGLSMGWTEGIAGKWLEVLQETVPRLSTIAVIANPGNPMNRDQAKKVEAIAPTRGLKVQIIGVRGPDTLDRAFEQAARTAEAVLVLADSMLITHQRRVVALAARHRLPDMHVVREFVDVGGLMAYAPDLIVMYRRAADYVDKIIKGAKPSELPIEQPTQYTLVINLKTAKALGIKIPESILLRADEVIR